MQHGEGQTNGYFTREIVTINNTPTRYVAYVDQIPLRANFGGRQFTITSKITRKQKGNFELAVPEVPNTTYPHLFGEFAGRDNDTLEILGKQAGPILANELDTIIEENEAEANIQRKRNYLNTLNLLFNLEIARRYVESDGQVDQTLAIVPFGVAIASARTFQHLRTIFIGDGDDRVESARNLIREQINRLIKNSLRETFGGEDESDDEGLGLGDLAV